MRTSAGTAWIAILVAAATTGLASVVVEGQSAKAADPAVSDLRARVEALPGTAEIKSFIASRLEKGFTPPRTPWGDPDISGNFNTSPEANTPMERPDEWAGRGCRTSRRSS